MASSSRRRIATAAAFSSMSTTAHPYEPPSWTKGLLENLPQHGRLHLANLPTPIYKLPISSNSKIFKTLQELGVSLYVKRDDMTGGVELGGNKIRKLEFLLADALAQGHDSVVTIGGEQSNHCRATAAACRMVGLEPHLILRTNRANAVHQGKQDFGYVGNILFDRMVGSHIYTCTPGEYGRVGSQTLVSRLCEHLKTEKNRNPYAIPVGGSNGIGTWGYINGVDELIQQWNGADNAETLDHVVFACGSGGTATGIALGLALVHGAPLETETPKVHAVGVCDNPDYFYNYVASIANEMGLKLPSDISTLEFCRQHMLVHQGKGLGYAASTPEELNFCTQFALETGIVLDPVYSGKAMYHFMTHVLKNDPESFRGKNILFWHTGGSLGMYDKGQDLLLTMDDISPVQRLDVYGKDGADGVLSI